MMERVDRYKAALDAARPFEGDLLKELRDYYSIFFLSNYIPSEYIST